MSSTTTIQPYHGSYLMPSLEHATVADAMHPGILSCQADATLTDVARIMGTHHVHSVAVMGISENQSGESLVCRRRRETASPRCPAPPAAVRACPDRRRLHRDQDATTARTLPGSMYST